ALQKHVKEEIDHFSIAAALMPPSHRRRVGSAAVAIVAGGGQSQRQVLPQQERLAVEPGTTALPARHRRWKEQLLTELFEIRGQRLRAETMPIRAVRQDPFQAPNN